MSSFHDIGLQVIADVSAAVAAGPTTLPDRRGMVPGQIAWDSCGSAECGQLAVSISRLFLSNTFPVDAIERMDACGAPYVCADYILQLIRCVPNPDQAGNPPSAAALQDAAQVIDLDAETVLPAVACSLQELMELYTIGDYVMRQAPVVGPSGGCAGIQVNFAVARVRT
jgi:hypothetical protein